MTISQWADEHRFLSLESSGEPGKWSTSRAEYQREMMDCVNDPDVEEVVFETASQIGKTDMLNNIMGYFIHHDPSPIMIVQPTFEMGMAWSKDRFAPMIRDTPVLRTIVKESSARNPDNTIMRKSFPGGHLTVGIASSAASLAMRPVRILLLDEVDRYPPTVGAEGDPLTIARKRTQAFWNRKIVAASTPTLARTSRIDMLYKDSSQGFFYVPCRRCGKEQQLIFEHLKFDKENLAWCYYECAQCNAQLSDGDKLWMVARGKWIHVHPERKRSRGYNITELYSPWSMFISVAESFLRAKRSAESLRVWVNQVLAQVWEQSTEADVRSDDIISRTESWDRVPCDVAFLTAGVDVQDDRLEAIVKGWGKDWRSWLVDRRTFWGSPSQNAVWMELDEYLSSTWENEDGAHLAILATCIDSGGHFTDQVYQFCALRWTKRIFAIKGIGGFGRPLISRPSRNNKFRVPVFILGVDTAKETIYARLKEDDPEAPGYMRFKADIVDEEYFRQLTSERQVIKYKAGHPYAVWVQVHPRNEALDLEVYALAARTIVNIDVEKRLRWNKQNRSITQQINTKRESRQREERFVRHVGRI